MKILCIIVFAISAAVSGATHVFWYKAIERGYNLQDNPGPNIPPGAVVHERMIMSAGVAQHSGAATDGFFCGSGLDDAQGRCGVVWSRDLCEMQGTCTSAKFRAEFRDGWSGNGFCNAGPITILCGVKDFQGNLDVWGGPDLVSESATWQDFLEPLCNCNYYYYEFDGCFPMYAEDTIHYTAPAGRPGESEPSVLDKQFAEIDITDQVNWILSHTGENKGTFSGQYAIAFCVTPGMGSTGKINCYADEAVSGSQTAMGSDAPWTKDGNTAHILLEGSVAVEKDAKSVLTGLSLARNIPNPFSASSEIAYNTGKNNGMLKIYSPAGKLVFSREVTGNGSLEWNAGKLGSGIYIARLTAGGKTISRRLVLAR